MGGCSGGGGGCGLIAEGEEGGEVVMEGGQTGEVGEQIMMTDGETSGWEVGITVKSLSAGVMSLWYKEVMTKK